MKTGCSQRFGPGFLVTAAFIGPGTVTTACVAGDTFGFTLWWAIPFAVLAVCILQDMAVRLGLVTGNDLGESLRHISKRPVIREGAVTLGLSAILIGKAAYQAGNLTGAAVGLGNLTGLPKHFGVSLSGLLAMSVLWLGVYGSLQTRIAANRSRYDGGLDEFAVHCRCNCLRTLACGSDTCHRLS
jgi:NRAMP (natural resistance-associated macrophage protein)-like metal ion transporter